MSVWSSKAKEAGSALAGENGTEGRRREEKDRVEEEWDQGDGEMNASVGVHMMLMLMPMPMVSSGASSKAGCLFSLFALFFHLPRRHPPAALRCLLRVLALSPQAYPYPLWVGCDRPQQQTDRVQPLTCSPVTVRWAYHLANCCHLRARWRIETRRDEPGHRYQPQCCRKASRDQSYAWMARDQTRPRHC